MPPQRVVWGSGGRAGRAAGYDAGAAVWSASEFRESHQQALDWLNLRTDQRTEFFGVVLEVLQIDDSRPAYHFEIVPSPNAWRKTAIVTSRGEPSPKGEAYRLFFQDPIDRLRERHQVTQARKSLAQN